jgi:fibronectin type 3 domain-containing protein
VRTRNWIQPERIDIYRLIEPAGAPQGVTPADYAARSTLVASIPGTEVIEASAQVTFDDPLEIKPNTSPSRYRYAVRVVDRNGRAGDLSNYALIVPLSELARPPENVTARVTQFDIEITWSPPQSNESGSTPANVAGYNIYRKTGDALARVNTRPLTELKYSDRNFQFAETYEYLVRTVSLPAGSSNLTDAIEGNDSQVITVTPKDTFAPAPPDSIKVASVNAVVSLFWPSNSEPDLAGYNIYRSEDENLPPAQWLKLTPRLHTPTTFRDDKVQVGRKYSYQLTAVDTSGNESARSATISETVNP